jgi:tRNA threonylcarbamoyladenosine biosynthesis protein TsaE
MLEITTQSAGETRKIGEALGGLLDPGDVIALDGDLGSGKTTLVQGIAAGWGSPDRVTSPTFVIINEYRRAEPVEARLYHMDAYRLASAAEAADLDLDACLAAAPLVVEWASLIRDALPDDFLHIEMTWLDDECRRLDITARGGRYQNILTSLTGQTIQTSDAPRH